MAALQTLQTLETLETPRVTYDAANGKIILDEEKWMKEWAKFRECMSVQRWLEELMSAERADFVKLKDFKIGFGPKNNGTQNVEVSAIHRNALTQEEKSEIRRLRKDGISVAVLAKRFGCGRSSVARVVQEREKELAPAEIQLILHLHHCEDVSIKQLATRFGVTGKMIHEIFAEFDKRSHNADAIKRSPSGGELELGDLSLPGPGER